MKFERLEKSMSSLVDKDKPPFTKEELALICWDLSGFVDSLLASVFADKSLLIRIVYYFQGIITLVLKYLKKGQDAPGPLLLALSRIFDGDILNRRFFLTFGVCSDDTFINGEFAESLTKVSSKAQRIRS
jgi:hypothetical protein